MNANKQFIEDEQNFNSDQSTRYQDEEAKEYQTIVLREGN
jgi:hypothetical protein